MVVKQIKWNVLLWSGIYGIKGKDCCFTDTVQKLDVGMHSDTYTPKTWCWYAFRHLQTKNLMLVCIQTLTHQKLDVGMHSDTYRPKTWCWYAFRHLHTKNLMLVCIQTLTHQKLDVGMHSDTYTPKTWCWYAFRHLHTKNLMLVCIQTLTDQKLDVGMHSDTYRPKTWCWYAFRHLHTNGFKLGIMIDSCCWTLHTDASLSDLDLECEKAQPCAPVMSHHFPSMWMELGVLLTWPVWRTW